MVTKVEKANFVEISKVVQPDAQRRITLPKRLVKEGSLFRMSYNSDNGQILLEPQVAIPASELWVFENKDILDSIDRGMTETTTVDRGSFAKYVKNES